MINRAFLICLLLAGFSLSAALELPPGSAFAPEIRIAGDGSLLEMPEEPNEAQVDIYGEVLYLPFSSWKRFRGAFAGAFRQGKARHSIAGYQSPDSLLTAELNVIAGYEHNFRDEDYGFLYKGLRLKSRVGKRWQLNSLWWNGVFTGDYEAAQGSELIDGYASYQDEVIRLDNVSGDISYNARNLCLALGRGTFPIGNSISGSIILNENVNDYAYLLAEGRAGAFTLSFLHGTLKADSLSGDQNDLEGHKSYPDKYLALHQLGYHPGDKLSIFAGETIIYGNRSMDINYLLPNMFWRGTEHNLWDRDNVLIYGGSKFRAHPRLLLYAQAALDELKYGEIFSNWWGNKYALQGGLSYHPPLAMPDSEPLTLGLELTAVRPFTYTHYMNHTMTSHDGRSLGYAKGSNIVDFSLALKLPYKQSFLWQSLISAGKYGSWGHSYTLNYQEIFPGDLINTATADWFQGDKTNYAAISNSLLIDIFAHHRLLLSHRSSRNGDWEHNLAAAWQFVY